MLLKFFHFAQYREILAVQVLSSLWLCEFDAESSKFFGFGLLRRASVDDDRGWSFRHSSTARRRRKKRWGKGTGALIRLATGWSCSSSLTDTLQAIYGGLDNVMTSEGVLVPDKG
jgi:hypothetical protein